MTIYESFYKLLQPPHVDCGYVSLLERISNSNKVLYYNLILSYSNIGIALIVHKKYIHGPT